MAMKPGFVSGGTAKLKVGKSTLAFATDVNVNVTMETIPIEGFGQVEVHSNEPVTYAVDGSFRIIRYTSLAKTAGVQNAAANGNSPAQIVLDDNSTLGSHVNPVQLTTSSTFTMELLDRRAAESSDQTVYKVQDCRIVSRTGTLDRRGVLVETFNFVGKFLQDSDAPTANQFSSDS